MVSSNWWKDGTVYQIWPASYKDSNGDGMGDIPGIITTLDYVKDLGVDTIWLSPMYDSPQVDMGYDISNYEDVYSGFGTLADMELLIKEVHQRGMRLILDLVVNHTSDQHAWFKESASSKDNPKSDWYIWKPARLIDGKRQPPTNWSSIFGGSAWAWCEARQEYYLHLFAVEQPDLNWENPETRQAIYKSAIEFWLSRGIDGFRVDTVDLYSKDTSYPDAQITNPEMTYQRATEHFSNGPRMHEFLKEMRTTALDKYGDVMMVGELGNGDTVEDILAYVSQKHNELSMVFDFDICKLGGWATLEKHEIYWHKLTSLKAALGKTQSLIPATGNSDGWTSIFAENHDQGRSISRLTQSPPSARSLAGKLLATLLASLSGTLFIYQGQEIGMTNVPESWGQENYKDIDAINYLADIQDRYPNNAEMARKALYGLQRTGRDNARTPVQWDSSPSAGFTTGTPWMRVNDNYKEVNVAAQVNDENSVLTYWKRMLRLRKKHAEVFVHGGYEVVDERNEDVYTFWKRAAGEGKEKAWTVCNFTGEEKRIDVPVGMEFVLGNGDGDGGEVLRPWEARIYMG